MMPVLRQEMVVENIDHDAGESSSLTRDPATAPGYYWVGIGITVYLSMQCHCPGRFRAIAGSYINIGKRAFHEVTQHAAEHRILAGR
jgi:hypothetical protein